MILKALEFQLLFFAFFDLIPSPPNEHAASIFQWLLALIAVRAFFRAKKRDCAHQSGIVPYFTHLLEFLFAWDDEWWGCKGFNHPAVWFAAPNSSIFDRPWVWNRSHFAPGRFVFSLCQSKWFSFVPPDDQLPLNPGRYHRLGDPPGPLPERLFAYNDNAGFDAQHQFWVIYGFHGIDIGDGRTCGHIPCGTGPCLRLSQELDQSRAWNIIYNLGFTIGFILWASRIFNRSLPIAYIVVCAVSGCGLLMIWPSGLWSATMSLDDNQLQLIHKFVLYAPEIEQSVRQLRRVYFDSQPYGVPRPIDILFCHHGTWAWCRADTIPSPEHSLTWLKLGLRSRNRIYYIADVLFELWTLAIHTILPFTFAEFGVNLVFGGIVASIDNTSYTWATFISVNLLKALCCGITHPGDVMHRWVLGDTWLVAWYITLYKSLSNVTVRFLWNAIWAWGKGLFTSLLSGSKDDGTPCGATSSSSS